MTRMDVDLLIIGGGPAGLCAAISGASEGLKTVLLDNGNSMGGQAKESSAIENYPGFPGGVTGEKLMGCFVHQAADFNTAFVAPTNAVKLTRDGSANRLTVTTDDYSEFVAKAVIISTGLHYRRLDATGISQLMGRGVYYGAPGFILNAQATETKHMAIIGGANSAGQAAVKLASNPNNKVTMFIREKIEDKMSQYLVDRIKGSGNIEVCEGCSIMDVVGTDWLNSINVKHTNGDTSAHKMDYMFIFIGAMPRTFWLESTIQLDENKFILTGSDLVFDGHKEGNRPTFIDGMEPLAMETSLPGVFAAGDVRFGSTKRVAVAAGEGATALQMVHRYMAKMGDRA